MQKLQVILFFTILTVFPAVHTLQGQNSKPEVFMWTGAQVLHKKDPKLLDNMLLFARRMNIIPYSSGMSDTTNLKNFLGRCRKHSIPKTWIEVGPGKNLTIKEFVRDSLKRAPIIQRFTQLARIYKEYYPENAHITIFDEAPLGAFGIKNSKKSQNYEEHMETFFRYGPRAYHYLHKAIKQVMPKAEVGIFLHHPHNAPPEMAGNYSFIEQFMEDCKATGTVPDFIYSDLYRGYLNRGGGMEMTNTYITSLIKHTKKIADEYDTKAYHLGQMHTIKLGYTPSKWEIDQNVKAMMAGKPDGIGWYWPNYASTNTERTGNDQIGEPTGYDVSFDPFVPNSWGKIGPAGSIYGTSKDRFIYAYQKILEEKGTLSTADCFDIWLYGFDFDHNEHKLYLKTKEENNNEWELIGYFNPQQDEDQYVKGARKKYINSYDEKWHAIAFRGLKKEKYLTKTGNFTYKVSVKITSTKSSDDSELRAVYVMPYNDTGNFYTEKKISQLIEEQPRWLQVNSLTRHVRAKSVILKPEKSIHLKLK